MDFPQLEELFMRNLRLYHHPVALFFEADGPSRFQPTYRAKNRLSFCQFLAFAREYGGAVFMEADRLACSTAADLFGFKEERLKATKALAGYMPREEAERFYQARPRLAPGSCSGVGLAPLSQAQEPPDVVVFTVDALQATHLLDFYVAGVGCSEVTLTHHVNGAACGNSIKAFTLGTPQLALPCPGAFTSGKMDRSEMLLAFPWEALTACAGVLERRAAKGRVSLLGGPTLVGMDVCRNCPLIKFEKIGEPH